MLMSQNTHVTKASEIKREWHLIDLSGKILGRSATEIARFLIGKHKPYFTANLDCGDYVVAINAEKVEVSGKKAVSKLYYRHSGYPGGFKQIPYQRLMEKNPARIIELAVSGMLPKNKLRSIRLRRLKVFAAGDHPYKDRFKDAKSRSPEH